MQIARFFSGGFHNPYEKDMNRERDDDFQGPDSGIFPMGFGLPDSHRVMQVYLLPRENEHSPWKLAGMALLLLFGVFAGLFMVYYCVERCCCYSKKKTETEDEENADEAPSCVNGEHRVSLPSELPPIDAVDKQTCVPASFLESPTLNVSQPFQPEPEDLARMQEVMLAKLEATNDDWEMGHGDLDEKPLY